MDAYVLLNVSEDADDTAIKEAYLSATRQYPPEQHPEMFEAIRSAYETIANERKRLSQELFQHAPIEPTTLTCLFSSSDQPPLFKEKFFKQALLENTESLIKRQVKYDRY
jgi:curved DNA-binding protein CbpA